MRARAWRFELFGEIDDAHAAFADLLQQFVVADDRTGLVAVLRYIASGGCWPC
jgi:hypothetical protein